MSLEVRYATSNKEKNHGTEIILIQKEVKCKMVKVLVGVISAAIIVIGMMSFLDIGTQITWTTYLGIPLVILIGSAGVAFITRRFEAIIAGVILSILLPVLIDTVKSVLSTL